MPSDEESGDESLQDEFKRFLNKSHLPFCQHLAFHFSLSPETQALQRLEWAKELEALEDEIDSLEETVKSKVRHAQNLKKSLGVTAWREFSDDVRGGMKKFQESPMYQKVQTELEVLASKVEEETQWVRSKASSLTSEHLASAQQKLTKKLQKIGIMEPSREYRRASQEVDAETISNQ